MSLFQLGDFKLASGEHSCWKIECDALTETDWRCAAYMIERRYDFGEVHGVPRGGNRLAELLQSGTNNNSIISLIVDDVYTTGNSIRAMRDKLILRPNGGAKRYLGCVLFARTTIHKADNWVSPLLQCVR